MNTPPIPTWTRKSFPVSGAPQEGWYTDPNLLYMTPDAGGLVYVQLSVAGEPFVRLYDKTQGSFTEAVPLTLAMWKRYRPALPPSR